MIKSGCLALIPLVQALARRARHWAEEKAESQAGLHAAGSCTTAISVVSDTVIVAERDSGGVTDEL